MDNSLNKDSGDAYLDILEQIGKEDAEGLKKAQQSYGNSWKSRGGVGAFMMLARKWDRLENQLSMGPTQGDIDNLLAIADVFEKRTSQSVSATNWPCSSKGAADALKQFTKTPFDIFSHIAADQRSEGLIDDIRDLRRYLMLVEAEMRARGFVAEHRDNKED